jgi:hypothetical protein
MVIKDRRAILQEPPTSAENILLQSANTDWTFLSKVTYHTNLFT